MVMASGSSNNPRPSHGVNQVGIGWKRALLGRTVWVSSESLSEELKWLWVLGFGKMGSQVRKKARFAQAPNSDHGKLPKWVNPGDSVNGGDD
ncbi:hypothetical protein COCNU_08G004950 [Cocos nucifera]|uniref:Uncharacterized protein n=1 Tax=Cocos nucifera TaxID=13894 RepID=A0A8K0IH64_COCNU|nr:hypothetical protein COCNU_08G004950 [Cocos nucifera]